MHRSALAGFIIDCRVDSLHAAADFWGAALGRSQRPSQAEEDAGYIPLETKGDGLHIEVQRVAHESRLHLDIVADDVEAEVQRLENLGARRVQRVRDWWVLEAPTGQRFCVVPLRNGQFRHPPNVWP
ncbi:MAG: VOC family protein [Steroidobacteraceae bacterium]